MNTDPLNTDPINTDNTTVGRAAFERLRRSCGTGGPAAMFTDLAASLAARGRWHALFDLRLLEARHALGLPPSGDLAALALPPDVRAQLDERSLAACQEVGWPLLAAGQVAAGWMYLRAAAQPADVAARLATLSEETLAEENVTDELSAGAADDEEVTRRLQEIVGVALWEGVDPALGLSIVLRTQGTCNGITAYEQAVSRLPAHRQEPAAAVLVAHLHGEIARAGGFAEPGLHCDVSHLQSVLRIARVCTTEPALRQAWELAAYACRLPPDVVYPGEPPFEHVAEASRLWYAAQIGRDVEEAVAYFRRAFLTADPQEAGTLPCDALVVLLARLGRPGDALQVALERPRDDGMPSGMQALGMMPSLVELAAASGHWEMLRRACIERGDEITFAATLAAEQRQQPRRRGAGESSEIWRQLGSS
jgi:hypothetical protein